MVNIPSNAPSSVVIDLNCKALIITIRRDYFEKLIALGLLTALSFSVVPEQGQVLAAPQQKTLYQQDNSSSVRQNVINSGMKYLGTPYEFGSSRSNTNTFDCSDFVRQAYWEGSGVLIPANSRTQGAYIKQNGTVTKDWRGLKPGDIMFFMSYKGIKTRAIEVLTKVRHVLRIMEYISGMERFCIRILKHPVVSESIQLRIHIGKRDFSLAEVFEINTTDCSLINNGPSEYWVHLAIPISRAFIEITPQKEMV